MKWVVVIMMVCSAQYACANIVITEVNYDASGTDDGNEWIEIHNDATDPVDITGWKLFENNTNHALTSVTGGFVIPAHGYAIIADRSTNFQSLFPNFSGILLDSAFSLSNAGELIAIRSADLSNIDSLTYDVSIGAAGDGNTLQKNGSVFISAAPTPGAVVVINQGGGSNPPAGGSGDTGNSGSGQGAGTTIQSPKKSSSKVKFENHYDLNIVLPKRGVVVHDETQISVDVVYVAYSGLIDKKYGVFNISYGDGVTETLDRDGVISHAWEYPGSYTVSIEYRTSELLEKPLAEKEFVVTVLPHDLVIESDDFGHAIIKNNTSKDIDISGWILSLDSFDVVLPRNTIVVSDDQIAISQQVAPVFSKALLSSDTGVLIAQNVPTFDNESLPLETSNSVHVDSLTDITNHYQALNSKENVDNAAGIPVGWLLLSILFFTTISLVVSRYFVGSPVSLDNKESPSGDGDSCSYIVIDSSEESFSR